MTMGTTTTTTTPQPRYAPPRTKRVHAFAVTLAPKELPAEIQLWNPGENPTDYGVHLWNDRSVDEVMARYTERGNPLLIDVEHNGAAHEDGEPALTGGYAKLDIRDGAPWLTFDWSDYAVSQIESRQRLFLSPEYDVDPNTNEIVRLVRVSLVADPGTHRARMLATSRVCASADDGTASIPQVLLEWLKTTGEDVARAFAEKMGLDADQFVAELKSDKKAPDDGGADTKKPAFASSAVRRSATAYRAADAALRDVLLQNHGHRLTPTIREWAKSQTAAVVKAVIDRAPAAAKPTAARIWNSASERTNGLKGEELEKLQRGLGTYRSPHREPYTDPSTGNFVIPTVTPADARKMVASRSTRGGR